MVLRAWIILKDGKYLWYTVGDTRPEAWEVWERGEPALLCGDCLEPMETEEGEVSNGQISGTHVFHQARPASP
jgi:hypothetical protein